MKKDLKAIKKSMLSTLYILTIAALFVAIVFGTVRTYAWFSSLIRGLDGDLSLGELSGNITIYENSTTSPDGLTDGFFISSSGTDISAYNIIDKPWHSGQYASLYISVNNTGTIDLKAIFKMQFGQNNYQAYLSYFYYQITDIKTELNNSLPIRNQIATYNSNFQTEIESNKELYHASVIAGGQQINSNQSYINMGQVNVDNTEIFRLDIAMTDIPSQLLTEYNLLTEAQKTLNINANITLKQTNAPDSDNDDSGVVVEVSTADAFINAITRASNGDTIFLSASIVVPRNITITHRINIRLNGNTLTINGNLAYDFANTGSLYLDVSNSKLEILGNLIIDTPNATFKLLGAGNYDPAVLLGNDNDETSGKVYINTIKDDQSQETYGFYQYGVILQKRASSAAYTLAAISIDSNTRVTIGVGASCGVITAVDGASNIEIFNMGEIQGVDLSKMRSINTSDLQIYIYNGNRILTTDNAIKLPTWSLGWRSKDINNISSPVNTRIVNGPSSFINYGVTGSSNFTNADIENDEVSESVIDLGNRSYRVNIQLSNQGEDSETLQKILQQYHMHTFNSTTEAEFYNWLEQIRGLELYTYNIATLKAVDFIFIKERITGVNKINIANCQLESNTIPTNAFYNLASLQEIIFPNRDFHVGAYAFFGTSIKKISLTNAFLSVGDSAFDISTKTFGRLEVIYSGENVTRLMTMLSGFNVDKTLMFLPPAHLPTFKSNFAIGEKWYIHSYRDYDFVVNNTYYKTNSTNAEVVYFDGDWQQGLQIASSVSYQGVNYSVTCIGASAYRRAIGASENEAVDLIFPNSITMIKSDAFYAGNMSTLSLNNVSHIGNYAFKNTSITTSTARASGFSGMQQLGDYAFENARIGTSVTNNSQFTAVNTLNGMLAHTLDLHGNYTLGRGVFNSATMYGVVLNLSYAKNLSTNHTDGLMLYGVELILNDVQNIAAYTFENKFKNTAEFYMFNKISVFNVKEIGEDAFKSNYVQLFEMGINTLYLSQRQVDDEVRYGSLQKGILGGEFRAVNFVINGLLPQTNDDRKLGLFGTQSSIMQLNNVTLKNMGSTLYDYMFYGDSANQCVNIDTLNLYEITNIGSYAFSYATVNNINFYNASGNAVVNNFERIGNHAFYHSTFANLGILDLNEIGEHAFDGTILCFTSFTLSAKLPRYAFANANTTNVNTFNFQSGIASHAFLNTVVKGTSSIEIYGDIDAQAFNNTAFEDVEIIKIHNSMLSSNAFYQNTFTSTTLIELLQQSQISTNAFNATYGDYLTINASGAISIESQAFSNLNIQTLVLGNHDYYMGGGTNYKYGSREGGIFSSSQTTNLSSLEITANLPHTPSYTQILGSFGANINIGNIIVASGVTCLPNYAFASTNKTSTVRVGMISLNSSNLEIGAYAFKNIIANNIIATANSAICFVGTHAFESATIGVFENFIYLDSASNNQVGVIKNVQPYTFLHAQFGEGVDLSWLNYVSEIGHGALASTTMKDNTAKQYFDFSNVINIGYNIFENINYSLGLIKIGNNAYYQENISNYFYGNPNGSEGIISSTGNVTIDEIIITGNLPNGAITADYQTRLFGSQSGSIINIGQVIIDSTVTRLPAYTFAGWDYINKTNITNVDILSNLTVHNFAFAFANIENFNTSNGMLLNSSAFENTDFENLNHTGVLVGGEIAMVHASTNVFKSATFKAINGFSAVGKSAFKNLSTHAFNLSTFGKDINYDWLTNIERIEDYAFSRATFSPNSSGHLVQLDISNVVTIGERIFEFIPIQIGQLTIGNSDYNAQFGAQYSYGRGIDGMMYAAGKINNLIIKGDLPQTSTQYMLGNTYLGSTWAANYEEVVVSSSVSQIPVRAFASSHATVPTKISALTINGTHLIINEEAFENTSIGLVNSQVTELVVGHNAFYQSKITLLSFASKEISLGENAFAFSQIETLNYRGATDGNITMSGAGTFMRARINAMTGLVVEHAGITRGIISHISANAFKETIFGDDVTFTWLEKAHTIESYAFSGTLFGGIISLDLTNILTIKANAFYQLPVALGEVRVGNSSYMSHPDYAYGNEVNGIFNNVGEIKHLIISGNLPEMSYMLGNTTSSLDYVTTYNVVDVLSNVTRLPSALFASRDGIYATIINQIIISSNHISVGEKAFKYAQITRLIIPDGLIINGVDSEAFYLASIGSIVAPSEILLNGTMGAYAFYGINLTDFNLNFSGVTQIGEYAFAKTTYNKDLVFRSSIDLSTANFAFYMANISKDITFDMITSVAPNMFHSLSSGDDVTYTFTFHNLLLVNCDYPFANMNGGGSVTINIFNLPALDSNYAFFNSTNIKHIILDESVISLNGDNVFENANHLVSVTIENRDHVVNVNQTITTISNDTRIYIPGNLLNDYLLHANWSLIASQISTNFNISDDRLWGFYIVANTNRAIIINYFGTASYVRVPSSLIYKGGNYTVAELRGNVFAGSNVTMFDVPSSLDTLDMEVFSNPNIVDFEIYWFEYNQAFTLHVENSGGNKIIYESGSKLVLLKYFSSNTATTFTIPSSVVSIGEKAFNNIQSLQYLEFTAGTIQTSSNYTTTYPNTLILAENAITNNPNLLRIYLRNNSSGQGIVLNSYSISSNPKLTHIVLTGFSNTVASYAVYNNTALQGFMINRVTEFQFGGTLSGTVINAFAFFGSGTTESYFYLATQINHIFAKAFTYSKLYAFEFDSNAGNMRIYNTNAFYTGMEITTDTSGNIVQITNPIKIRVPDNNIGGWTYVQGIYAHRNSLEGAANLGWGEREKWNFQGWNYIVLIGG